MPWNWKISLYFGFLTYLLHVGATQSLGWYREEPYEETEMIHCMLILSVGISNHQGILNHIQEILIKGVLEKYSPGDVRMVIGKYDGLGTRYYVFEGAYADISHTIFNELENDKNHWIQSWGDLSQEVFLEQRLDRIDELAKSSTKRLARKDTNAMKSKGNKLRNESYNATHKKLRPRAVVKSDESRNIPFDLRYHSTPPPGGDRDYGSPGALSDYYFESSEGEGVDIYVIDTGFEFRTTHGEFAEALARDQIKGYIFPVALDAPHDKVDYDPQSTDLHGTVVTSKIIGKRAGMARKANIWVAPMVDAHKRILHVYLLDLFLKVRDNIKQETQKNPNYRAIINLSMAMGTHRDVNEMNQPKYHNSQKLSQQDRAYILGISDLGDLALKSLLELDNVVLVTGAGNDPLGNEIRDWPAKLGASYKNMIVVGSVDRFGAIRQVGKIDFVEMYGLEEMYEIPDLVSRMEDSAETPDKYIIKNGVSYTNACVAAILATHLSANPDWSVTDAVNQLYQDAYPRKKNGPKVIWTGVRPTPELEPTGRPKRKPTTKASGSGICKGPRRQSKSKKGQGRTINRRQDVEEGEMCENETEGAPNSDTSGEDPDSVGGEDSPEYRGDFISTRTVLEVYKTKTEVITIRAAAPTFVKRLSFQILLDFIEVIESE
ncbi:hypothetical protein H072_127 [Dactylellina haptotyla CBS 200.50]|uniref:Peptidase S8/S53 domain-containing protein n=1 Tax=Dactylellina haptotyla (strain CBS 200.50) TaxID=1284197 RepID=S8AXT7_DACHA|nr:hypothetical protein H072_127 [Dactylellina haptotyla CBS 200.50]